jgi:glycosyltransferase involved in cell wall biosynthesis
MPESLSLSVIIPTCNRPGELEACLKALRGQGADEVIVCDDGTGASEVVAAGLPSARVVAGARRGPGANRNAGASAATGKWLLFVDDDCLPWPEWVAAYRSTIACLPPGAPRLLAGRTVPTGPGADSLLHEAPQFTGGAALPPSCNFAIAAETFRAAGGFDPRYRTSFEDMEFFARLSASGVWISYVETAGVAHPRRKIPSSSRLADRWEARVVSSIDWGASARDIYLQLPRHVALVIASRFRNRSPRLSDTPAAALFAAEFALVLVRLPKWIAQSRAAGTSQFWNSPEGRRARPPRFGL